MFFVYLVKSIDTNDIWRQSVKIIRTDLFVSVDTLALLVGLLTCYLGRLHVEMICQQEDN